MSGHSKWSQIKRAKGAADSARSKVFGKLGRFIAVEAKKANGDVNAPGLRVAIEKAKKLNMPKDTIERAIKKGSSNEEKVMEALTYEAYGPGGAGIIIEALTDNRNKAAQEIKYILNKHGASLGAIGSVVWAFTKTHDGWEPQNEIELEAGDAETIEKIIEELEDNDEVQDVYTNATSETWNESEQQSE